MQLRKLSIIIMILICSAVYAQQPSNRFAEEENAKLEQFEVDNAKPYKDDLPQGPGNPGDPVPIDSLIPVLILTAVGIITYRSIKKNAI